MAESQYPHVPFLTEEQLKEYSKEFPNLTILPQQLAQLSLSKIRPIDCGIQEFRYHSNRIIRLLIEQALAIQEHEIVHKKTPLATFDALQLKQENQYVAVMIMRAGNSFMFEMLNVLPEVQFGTILVQRDETCKEKKAVFLYEKWPQNMQNKNILICDPMLATGGSVIKTIEQLLKQGVKEEKITFLNIMGCKEGLQNLYTKYPKVKTVVATIEPILTSIKYLSPGIGDFGDRYFGTVHI